MVNIRKFLQGIGLVPKSSSTIDTQGEMEVLSSDGRLYQHDGTNKNKLVGTATVDTLTNKSIDGGSNTLTNIPTSGFTGQVSVANGGTGVATIPAHAVVLGEGTSNIATAAPSTAGQALISNGASTDPSFQTLPISGGGSGQITQQAAIDALTGTQSSGKYLRSDGTHSTLSSLAAADLTGQVAIANGGTGQATKTAGFDALSPTTTKGDIIVNNGSNNIRQAIGSDTFVLTADSAQASGLKWASAGTTSPLTTKGDLYGFNTANARIPIGTDGQVLVADSTQTLGLKWGAGIGTRTINAQSGTTYTFVLSDGSNAGGNPLVTATNSAAQTYTVPTNASVAFPVGAQIDITQLGTGLVTLAAAGGVTLNSVNGGLSLFGQYADASLVKTATNTWEVYGTGVNSSSLALSDWSTQYTFTTTGMGTITNATSLSRRVGDSLEGEFIFTIGAQTGVVQINLPTGLTIDSTKFSSTSNGQIVGFIMTGSGSSQSFAGSGTGPFPIFYDGSTTNTLFISRTPNAGSFEKGNRIFNDNVWANAKFSIPISGWTSTSSGTLTAPRSSVYIYGGNGTGSTNVRVRRFSTSSVTGSAMTYTDSTTLGGSITIVTPGVYVASYTEQNTAGNTEFAVTLNATGADLTSTNIDSLIPPVLQKMAHTSAANFYGNVSCPMILSAGDIVRFHVNTSSSGGTGNTVSATLTQVSN